MLTLYMVRWIGLDLMTPKAYDNHKQTESAKRTYELENEIGDIF